MWDHVRCAQAAIPLCMIYGCVGIVAPETAPFRRSGYWIRRVGRYLRVAKSRRRQRGERLPVMVLSKEISDSPRQLDHGDVMRFPFRASPTGSPKRFADISGCLIEEVQCPFPCIVSTAGRRPLLGIFKHAWPKSPNPSCACRFRNLFMVSSYLPSSTEFFFTYHAYHFLLFYCLLSSPSLL